MVTGAELNALASFDEYTGLDVKHGQANEQALLAMTDQLNNGDIASIDSVLDVDAALRFIAFNTVTANMDSYAGNFKHNYYLYELDGRFTVIPWDLNMAFGGFGGTGILIDEPTGVALDSRPLVSKLIADNAYNEEYHQLIKQLIETSFGETFTNRVVEIKSLIDESVKNDPTAFVRYEEYEKGAASLLDFVDTQITSINKQLSGEMASYKDGSGSASGGPGGGMGQFGDSSPPEGMEMPDGMDIPEGMTPPNDSNAAQQTNAKNTAQPISSQTLQSETNTNNAEGNIVNKQMPGFENGKMPNMGGGRGQGGGGFGGAGFGGDSPFANNTANNTVSVEDQMKHLQTTLISIVLLALGCFVIVFWRRKH